MTKSDDEILDVIAHNIEHIVKPLGNKTRREILFILSGGQTTYTEMLDRLEIESGSFYWHIKKMELLVDQTPEKHYRLSTLGQKAMELLLTGGIESRPTEYQPDWYLAIRTRVAKINQLPTWILVQQVIILLIILSAGLQYLEILMVGTVISQAPDGEFIYISGLLSIVGIVALLILIIQLFIRFDIVKQPKINWIHIISMLSMTSLPIVIILVVEVMDRIISLPSLVYVLLLFVLSLLGLSANIIATTAAVDDNFEIGFKNAMIATLVVYYPVVLFSFLWVSIL